eukprot:GHVN01017618.1.p1 GENE.GHVN01017618.1~~GHVN01017618.1.p1  ORF type:complete len:275 (+),score=71.22 GHVN01017618.1:94-918(+)
MRRLSLLSVSSGSRLASTSVSTVSHTPHRRRLLTTVSHTSPHWIHQRRQQATESLNGSSHHRPTIFRDEAHSGRLPSQYRLSYPKLRVVELPPTVSILEMLLLEETLYRYHLTHKRDTNNGVSEVRTGVGEISAADGWVLTSTSVTEHDEVVVVLGMSGKVSELVKVKQVSEDRVPMIRRFTGGGTVLLNDECVMLSVILPPSFLPVQPYPKPTAEAVSAILAAAFPSSYRLIDADYTINIGKLTQTSRRPHGSLCNSLPNYRVGQCSRQCPAA